MDGIAGQVFLRLSFDGAVIEGGSHAETIALAEAPAASIAELG